MPATTCRKCGSSNLEENTSTGSLICTDCGAVCEENIIVSEVQFQQDGGGGNVMIGNFIADDGLNNPLNSVGQRNSREITLRKAKESIRHLCAQLRLKEHHTDESYNYYRLALSKSLTRGRKAEQVYASCVYLSCRTSTSPTEHMLLDFSEVLKINVFVLGKTFIQLTRSLNISLPLLDPAFYIYRFAHKLGFAGKSKDVIDTANRIVSRMKRDWMAVGRRPAGICGAAFVMAARLHCFKCDIEDITKVVKIGQNTIRKRLHEFGATPSAKLTIDEFLRIDLESEYDPPSYIKNQEELEYRILDSDIDINTQVQLAEDMVPEIEKNIIREENKMKRGIQAKIKRKQLKENISESSEEDAEMKAVRVAGFLNKNPEYALARLSTLNVPLPTEPIQNAIERPTCASLGINQTFDEMLETGKGTLVSTLPAGEDSGSDLDLEGIDDDEIDRMLLKPPEIEMKTKMWELRKDNIEWCKRQEEKIQEEINNPEKAQKRQRQQRKRKRNHAKNEHSTAGDAIQQVVKAKQKSSRINYDVLTTLKEALSSKKSEKSVPVTVKILNVKSEVNSDDDDEDDEEEAAEDRVNMMNGIEDIFGGNNSDNSDTYD